MKRVSWSAGWGGFYLIGGHGAKWCPLLSSPLQQETGPAPDAAQRAALAAWCAADPGSIKQWRWVPALRSSAKSAAPRPGHAEPRSVADHPWPRRRKTFGAGPGFLHQ